MAVITIRGQAGSGAEEIGRKLAEILHTEYVDKEIIEKVARSLRIPKHEINQKENPPGTFLGRLAEIMSYSSGTDALFPDSAVLGRFMPIDDASYVAALQRVIKGLSKIDPLVIRGRGSQFILKDYPRVFHVLIVAPLEMRIANVMDKLKIVESEARREIERLDASRREFIGRYFKADLEDPMNYDLVVNTRNFEFEPSARLIARAIELRG
jgi:cytidylate kinase